jgi:hypothetical protein
VSSLAELQRDLQRHVLTGDAAITEAVNGTVAVPAATRLAVYFGAYRWRLIEAVAANMPRLQQLLGEQEFAAIAGRYVDDYPSRFASIRWFGDRLAQVLAQSHPAQPWLAELAQWEWALASSFDARDAQPASIEALAAIAPGDWAELRLEFHPSVQYLRMTTNAPALFKALTEEQPLPEPVAHEKLQPWILWRQQLKTQYRSLEPAEAAALEVVREGGTFAAMCEALCNWYDADDVPLHAAGMLKRWLVEEMLIAVTPAP